MAPVTETCALQKLREVKRSEDSVLKVQESVKSFLNPFNVENKDKLYCISSGAPATGDIQDDVLRADKAGREAKIQFIKERLETKNNFF